MDGPTLQPVDDEANKQDDDDQADLASKKFQPGPMKSKHSDLRTGDEVLSRNQD